MRKSFFNVLTISQIAVAVFSFGCKKNQDAAKTLSETPPTAEELASAKNLEAAATLAANLRDLGCLSVAAKDQTGKVINAFVTRASKPPMSQFYIFTKNEIYSEIADWSQASNFPIPLNIAGAKITSIVTVDGGAVSFGGESDGKTSKFVSRYSKIEFTSAVASSIQFALADTVMACKKELPEEIRDIQSFRVDLAKISMTILNCREQRGVKDGLLLKINDVVKGASAVITATIEKKAENGTDEVCKDNGQVLSELFSQPDGKCRSMLLKHQFSLTRALNCHCSEMKRDAQTLNLSGELAKLGVCAS